MSIIGGKDAYVDGFACTQSWQVSFQTNHVRYSASCVAGATAVPKGVTDITGQMTGFGAEPPAFPFGTAVPFQGVVNNTPGDLRSLVGDILIEQLTIDWNAEDGSAIRWTATFGAIGDLTNSSTGAADDTVGASASGLDLEITLADSFEGSPFTALGVRSAQLIFRRPSTTYVDQGFTGRIAGNLEAELSFSVYDDDIHRVAYQLNSERQISLRTRQSPDEHWTLTPCRMSGRTGYEVNRDPPSVVGYTVNALWSGVTDDGAPGMIIGPSMTQYFPMEESS